MEVERSTPVHGLTRPGVTLALGGLDAAADASRSKCHRTGIPVRIQSYLKNKEDNMKNIGNIRPYEGDQRSRDREYLQRRLTKNTDVRYLENIKNRIRSSYFHSCNANQCPNMKERLNHHLLNHHTFTTRPSEHVCYQKKQDRACSPAINPESQATTRMTSRCTFTGVRTKKPVAIMSLSRSTSKSYVTMKQPSVKSSEIHSVQTSYTEFCKPASSGDKSRMLSGNDDTEFPSNKGTPQKPNGINTTNTSFYKERLQDEILKWSSDIPIYSNMSAEDKAQRERLVYELVNTINNFKEYINTEDYEEKVKKEIDVSLNILPMWNPESKQDKVAFKNSFVGDLLHKIKDLNNKWCNNMNWKINDKRIKYRDNTEYNNNNREKDNDEFKDCFNRKMRNNYISQYYNLENVGNYSNEENTVDSIFNNDAGASSRRIFTIEDRNEIIIEIKKWLFQIELKLHSDARGQINKDDVAEMFLNRLAPSLNGKMNYKNYKLVLKGEILDMLDDLSMYVSGNRAYFNRLAEDLANRLLSIRVRYEMFKRNYFRYPKNQNALVHSRNEKILGSNARPVAVLKQTLFEEVADRFRKTDMINGKNIEKKITDILIEYIESVLSGNDQFVRDEISTLLQNSNSLSEMEATDVSNVVVDSFKSVVVTNNIGTDNLQQPRLSGTVVVFQSDTSEPTKYPITSTPKKKQNETQKITVPKLNLEERDFLEKVTALVRSWMESLPVQFDKPEEREFKETIAYDLAGDLMDFFKLEQIVPKFAKEKTDYLAYVVYRWLMRYNIYNDLDSSKQAICDLVNGLNGIHPPQLTRPQHGNRQDMENLKYIHVDMKGPGDYSFVPTGTAVLEDEISIWMNEQPSKIYLNNDKSFQQKMIHELANKLHNRLRDKISDKDITEEVEQWLNKVLTPREQKNVHKLSEQLKDRIKKLPQDETLVKLKDKRVANIIEKRAYREALQRGENPCCRSQVLTECAPADNVRDLDKTLKEFIEKYLEHYYDSEDYTVRKAYGKILTTELRKLSPPTRKEVYDNFTKCQPHAAFSPEALNLELEIIKEISDWLKTTPVEDNFNEAGNVERINYITDLARSIYEVEAERLKTPDAMDYNSILWSVISESFRVLPIQPNYDVTENIYFLTNQLYDKIIAHRPPENCCGSAPAPPPPIKVKEEDIANIIQEFIQNNARDIADDPVKLEVWYTRLLKEVKRLVQETANLNDLSKGQIYHRLDDVPRPREDDMRRFNLKFEYMREAFLWLKNLPLQSISDEERIRLLQDLVNELVQRNENLKATNPRDSQADKEIVPYIANWILKLPFEPEQDIVLPVAIQQLMNRIQRVGNENSIDYDWTDASFCETPEKSKSKAEPADAKAKPTEQPCCGTLDPQARLKVDNPEGYAIETIVKWCNGLPIEGNDEDEVKALKDNMIKRLFERIWDLNINPRFFHDDAMYKDMLVDELDAQLEKLPQSSLLNNKEQLKADFIARMLEAKKLIQQKSAGEDYKQRLENTVEASMPNPVAVQPVDDPGFQIYKSHLASMFILENFDHTNEELKLKYEKRIKEKIDRYFEDAQRRNAVPLAKEQIYNELYASLFKVPIPNETSVVAEVEEVKTRCEIDAWFEELPIQKTYDKNELLQRDQILSTLSKRLYEIEKKETNPDEEMNRVIKKWLAKFPLLPGQEANIDHFAEKLRVSLKASREARRCVPGKESTLQDEHCVSHKSTDRQGSKDIVKGKVAQEHDPRFQLQPYSSPPAPVIQAISPHGPPITVVNIPSTVPGAAEFSSGSLPDPPYSEQGSVPVKRPRKSMSGDQDTNIYGKPNVVQQPVLRNASQASVPSASCSPRRAARSRAASPAPISYPSHTRKLPRKQCLVTGQRRVFRGPVTSDDEGTDKTDECNCISYKKKNCRGRPYCLLHVLPDCEDCTGFDPFWYGMPFHCPGCLYY